MKRAEFVERSVLLQCSDGIVIIIIIIIIIIKRQVYHITDRERLRLREGFKIQSKAPAAFTNPPQ